MAPGATAQPLRRPPLSPKARSGGNWRFADAIRNVGDNPVRTVADHLSLVLDASGYRQMLRDSRAENNRGRLDKRPGAYSARRPIPQRTRTASTMTALSTGGPHDDTTNTVNCSPCTGPRAGVGHIFLPAWENGVFPPAYGDHAEERRLAYVALTRGMRRVTISYCAFRHGPARPSDFIKDIPEGHRVQGWIRQPERSPRWTGETTP